MQSPLCALACSIQRPQAALTMLECRHVVILYKITDMAQSMHTSLQGKPRVYNIVTKQHKCSL